MNKVIYAFIWKIKLGWKIINSKQNNRNDLYTTKVKFTLELKNTVPEIIT